MTADEMRKQGDKAATDAAAMYVYTNAAKDGEQVLRILASAIAYQKVAERWYRMAAELERAQRKEATGLLRTVAPLDPSAGGRQP